MLRSAASGPSRAACAAVSVPERAAEDDKPERPAFTLFPRYHQSRSVRKVADDISAHFAATADIGRKYLVNHSAGSGKMLTSPPCSFTPNTRICAFKRKFGA